MLSIRLRRMGKKKQPVYRIIVTDSRNSVYAPYTALLGTYDPRTKATTLNQDMVKEWLAKGAQPSNAVAKILTKEGLKHKSIVVKKFKAISKKELEKQKAQEAEEKAKEQAEKEAAKEAFEAQVEQEKKENETVDPLLAAADEAIAEAKEEEAEKAPEETKEAPAEETQAQAEEPAEKAPEA